MMKKHQKSSNLRSSTRLSVEPLRRLAWSCWRCEATPATEPDLSPTTPGQQQNPRNADAPYPDATASTTATAATSATAATAPTHQPPGFTSPAAQSNNALPAATSRGVVTPTPSGAATHPTSSHQQWQVQLDVSSGLTMHPLTTATALSDAIWRCWDWLRRTANATSAVRLRSKLLRLTGQALSATEVNRGVEEGSGPAAGNAAGAGDGDEGTGSGGGIGGGGSGGGGGGGGGDGSRGGGGGDGLIARSFTAHSPAPAPSITHLEPVLATWSRSASSDSEKIEKNTAPDSTAAYAASAPTGGGEPTASPPGPPPPPRTPAAATPPAPPQPLGNAVTTSKYTLLTFAPVFLFEVFARVAYLYFLLQAALSWWRVVSPFSGIGSTAALIFVVAVSAVKAAVEDVRRHLEDLAVNRARTRKLQPDGSVCKIAWKDVRVGDVVEVRDGELIPADLLLLRAGLAEGIAFVRTTNLDGETNLKIRHAVRLPGWDERRSTSHIDDDTDIRGRDGSDSGSSSSESGSVSSESSECRTTRQLLRQLLTRVRGKLVCEPPSRSLHNFNGGLYVQPPPQPSRAEAATEMAAAGGGDGAGSNQPATVTVTTGGVAAAVSMDNMLLRGCVLKNSRYVLGLAVYCGPQTRIQMNAVRPPLKIGSFDCFLNQQIMMLLVLQLVLSVASAVVSWVWRQHEGVRRPHLALDDPVQGNWRSPGTCIVLLSITFWILYGYLVPISLFVTMELVKFWQAFVFINSDPALKEKPTQPPPPKEPKPPPPPPPQTPPPPPPPPPPTTTTQNPPQPITPSPTSNRTTAVLPEAPPPQPPAVAAGTTPHRTAVDALPFTDAAVDRDPSAVHADGDQIALSDNRSRHRRLHPSSGSSSGWQRWRRWWRSAGRQHFGISSNISEEAEEEEEAESEEKEEKEGDDKEGDRGGRGRFTNFGTGGGDGGGGGENGSSNNNSNSNGSTHAFARSSAVNEDLGRVAIVFSDKTGTLTRNDMRLRCCALGLDRYGSLDVRLEEQPELRGSDALGAFDPRLLQAASALRQSGGWRAAINGGGAGGYAAPVHSQGTPSNGRTLAASKDKHQSLPQHRHRRQLRQQKQQEQAQEQQQKVQTQTQKQLVSEEQALLAQRMVSFWLNVCVCNSVVLEPHKSADRPPAYQGPSPDEVALLDAARQLGFELAARRRDEIELRVVVPPSLSGSLQTTAAAQLTTEVGAVDERLRVQELPCEWRAAPAGPLPCEDSEEIEGEDEEEADEVEEGRSSRDGEIDDDNDDDGGGGGDVRASGGRPDDVSGGNEVDVVRYRVLNVLEFSSARKRMSVIVQAPDGSLALHTKGADSVILPRLASSSSRGGDGGGGTAAEGNVSTPPPPQWAVTSAAVGDAKGADGPQSTLEGSDAKSLCTAAETNLQHFATQGLRTLVLAARPLPDRSWYDNWDERYQAAAAGVGISDPRVRAAALDALADEMERDLELVGVAGIEDQLQEGVPEAVATLLAARVRVWMITGDKLETAVNIARAARLVTLPYDRQLLVLREHEELAIRQQLRLLSLRAATINAAAGGNGNDRGCSSARQANHHTTRHHLGVSPSSSPPAPVQMQPRHGNTALQADVDSNVNSIPHKTTSPDAASGSGGTSGGGLEHVLPSTAELVVDGRTLDMVLERKRLAAQLAALCNACAAVVVCRASPSQKAALVRLMKEHRRKLAAAATARRWQCVRQPLRAAAAACGLRSGSRDGGGDGRDGGGGREVNDEYGEGDCDDGDDAVLLAGGGGDPRDADGVLLAIGDGANDVAMIQAADVGVGVMGKEGRQAVNNSDVAVPLFRHLVPLLLVHGQLCSQRLSRLITYSFYKNLVYWGVLLGFQFYCGFSGQALIDDISGSFYNVVFTSMPILVVALQESHAPDPSSALLAHPELYNTHPPLTATLFWMEGMLLPLLHSAACFFVPLYGATPYGVLPVHMLWAVGKAVYVAVVVVVTAELLLTTRAWTRLLVVVCGLSAILPFPFLLLVWRLELAAEFLDEATVGAADILFISPYFWTSLVAVVALTAGSRYLERSIRWIFFPDAFMRLAREHALAYGGQRELLDVAQRLPDRSLQQQFDV